MEESFAVPPTRRKSPAPEPREPTPEPEVPTHSEAEPDSEDEYVAEKAKLAGKGKVRTHPFLLRFSLCSTRTQRRARRLSFSSESEAESESESLRLQRTKPSASPTPGQQNLKRKAQNGSTNNKAPASKRKKSETDATDDPARKYCLGKLEDVFRVIFLRYPRLLDSEAGEKRWKEGEITEEEKATLMEDSKQFAIQLEQCVYDIYCESDKNGRPSAAAKYKYVFCSLSYRLQRDADSNLFPFTQGTFPHASI